MFFMLFRSTAAGRGSEWMFYRPLYMKWRAFPVKSQPCQNCRLARAPPLVKEIPIAEFH
jgi:hypothetical protein